MNQSLHRSPTLRRGALATLCAFGLAAGTVSAQFTPVDVTFGSNNDGNGGFTTNVGNGNMSWDVLPDSLEANLDNPNTNDRVDLRYGR